MIYLKNNTEIQAIYIPRQTVLGGRYILSTKAYEKGYNDGLEVGKEQQKDKLSSLHVAENGQYEREDGWNVVTVDVPDLNGSYNEGYEQGKTDGIDEQKGKLESINITENGVYSKEDGYNHIEVNVPSYEEGQADMAAKARVLNVTENGTYLSKFSDPIPIGTITGVYNDGTKFNNYAELGNKVFNTNITVTQDSVIELWYKGDNKKTYDGWNTIFGCAKRDDDDFYLGYMYSDNTNLRGWIGQKQVRFSWDDNVWHHIKMKNDGLWVDDVLMGSFNTTKTFAYNLGLNGTWNDLTRNANGCYGMIKIDNVVIIPTADGFLNTNTGELLEVVKDGSYTFTEGQVKYGEGELYKTINVNVTDLNGSYDEGKTDGVNEQKSKLETINITENGTYNREDGYNKIIVKVPDLNGSYDEGYDQGQADIAENAKVLNVTENGVYKTKFSDPIMPTTVTGVYADGTEFYNYAELDGISYDSGFIVSKDMKVEIWWKGDVSKTDKNLFGSQVNNFNAIFKIRIPDTAYRFDGEIAMRQVTYLNAESDRWYHFKMSYADGFWVDGVKIGDFSRNISGTPDKLYINSNTHSSFNGANGYFGMIKITTNGAENIIIPTAEGLKNITTDEMLQVVKDGTYTFTKNLPTYGEGEIYKTINVNVPTAQGQSFDYDITAFTYKVYGWTSANINRDNMTNDCGHRPLDCLLFRNRSGECTVMTKLDNCSGVVRLENGWSGDSIILSLKSNTITKFSSNSINSNQLTSIDTGLAQLEENAIMNCNALIDIKLAILNNNLSVQFASNCFNGLPAEGTITIGKTADVTLTDDEITSFFRTIVGEGWTITIK